MNQNFTGRSEPLTQPAFSAALRQLDCKPAALWSLMTVETCGFGFLPDRRPKILFERHVFHRRTGGRHSRENPDISSTARGGYAGGPSEYQRLEKAMRLDRRAALESTSWGLPQIMGFNAASLHYEDAEQMVASFLDGEDAQLEAAIRFIRANPALAAALSSGRWNRVAYFYNGPAYAEHGYHTRLEHYCRLYTVKGMPSIDIRAAQARLSFLGFDPGAVDGIIGARTRQALRGFQRSRGLTPTGELDSGTGEALGA